MLLGFPLSLLFFMDQNIAESMVNSPDNKLLKGIFKLLTDLQQPRQEAFTKYYHTGG
jgi:hypothetical protein